MNYILQFILSFGIGFSSLFALIPAATAHEINKQKDIQNINKAEEAVFRTHYKGDTVAVEWSSRTERSVTATTVINEALEFRYTMVIEPRETISSVEFEFARPGSPSAKQSILLNPEKSSAGDAKKSDDKVNVRQGAVPFMHHSISLLEQIVRRARFAGGSQVEVSVFRLIGETTLAATVIFTGSDTARVEVDGKVYNLAIDKSGRIFAGQITDYGITIERLSALPRSAYGVWSVYGAPADALYKAEEVRVPTPQGHTLAGTLTLPTNVKGRVPAVVLITGLAKHNRNNGSPPLIPFRQIADTLSRRGIAVLRLDDRGVGESTGDSSTSTTFDEAEDVRSSLRYLRQRSEIDKNRTGLIGYSEGGIIAPLVAAGDTSLRGIVLMAAPAVGRETVEFQLRYEVERNPAISPEKREQTIADTIKKEESGPRVRSLLTIDGISNARQVKTPVLLLHGTTDRHVSPTDASRLNAAFRAGGNEDVTVRLFPGLNHLFLPDPIGRAGGFAFLPSMRVPSDVLNIMADWVVQHFN